MKHTPESVRELVERLNSPMDIWTSDAVAMRDAATMLSDLLAENERMREALKPFVTYADKVEAKYRKRGGNPDSFPDTHPFSDVPADALNAGVWRKARAALTPESKE